MALKPADGSGFDRFVVEANHGGQASALGLEAVLWGRLVDVYAEDPATGVRAPVFADLVVDPGLVGDGVDYRLERSLLTGAEELTVLHAFGSPGWESAFRRAEGGVETVLEHGLGVNELPPYTALPRNAALVLAFDDVLDDRDPAGGTGSVSAETVRVGVGYPPTAFFFARVVPDPSHGDLIGGTFHSTRVIVDMTVDAHEALATALPPNPVGLPAAVMDSQPNVALRLPTLLNPGAGQFALLRNLGGKGLSFAGNGPTDSTAPTLDVVRALRSGGGAVGDPYNGFLRDDAAPRVIGALPVLVSNVIPVSGGAAPYRVDLAFADPACTTAPAPGDLLVLSDGGLALVEQAGVAAAPAATSVLGVGLRPLASQLPSSGPGELRVAFDPNRGHAPACFVELSPPASAAGLVSPDASVRVAFDEPMDPATLDAFDAFRIVDPSQASPLASTVAGQVDLAPGADAFTLSPSVPLNHTLGQREVYRLLLDGATDLAGNDLAQALAAVDLTLDDTAPSTDTGSLALRFSAPDEDGDGGHELRGQLIFDVARGEVTPRAVVRFSREVNDSAAAAPTAAAMVPFAGRPDPLSPYGSRVQAVWRYHDLDMPLLDESTHNVDVEGLSWTPAAGGLGVNFFPEFQIGLSHCKYLPDEAYTPPNGVFYASSGLTPDYADNQLDPVEDPLTVVHPRSAGYVVQAIDTFTSPGGQVLAPYPLNRGIPTSQYRHWTWRDTAIQAVGGPKGQGVDTKRLIDVTGTGTADVYPVDEVPTIGLPLMFDLRSYPSSQIVGESRAMMALASPVGVPFFRAWSTGFVTPSGVAQPVDPDTLVTAIGGIDDAGNPIAGNDIGVYYGQADFVVRVSRAHTIWLDTGGTSRFGNLVFDPPLSEQPLGTDVRFAFRGATSVVDPTGAALDARNYDPYGDNRGPGGGFGVVFLNQDATWKDTLPELDGARWIQVRITLTGNAESGVLPRLSALGLPYFR